MVYVDVFESVRLSEACADFPQRWIAFLDEVRQQVLPTHCGRWVKSTGDGFLLHFQHAPQAAAAALDIQQRIKRYNTRRPAEDLILLRVGVHAGEVVMADFDIFGPAVNLSQRLTTASAPGEIIVSETIRSHLVNDLDGDLEDLGEVNLKHVESPMRVARLGPMQDHAVLSPVDARRNIKLKPTIAVLPFVCYVGEDPGDALGMALAEEVLVHLSRMSEFHVTHGNSCRQLHRRDISESQAAQRLDADLLLKGGYRLIGNRFSLTVQLTDVARGTVAMAAQYENTVLGAFDRDEPLAGRIVSELGQAVIRHAFELTNREPLMAVESYALLFGAVNLMHRGTSHDFHRARDLLQHLVDRQGRFGIAEAWLAKWHVLRVVQGWAPEPEREQNEALEHVKRSLDLNPNNALALSIGGLVHGYLFKDLDTAGRMYQLALDDNPNEPLAWLFSATRHAYLGQGEMAEDASDMALRLSPLDPLRYFFESLAATAVAGNGHFALAAELAQQSLKRNRTHASTWRTLVYALMSNGHEVQAREAVSELMKIEPALTVTRFRARFPGYAGPMGEPWARALLAAGVPK